MAKRETFVHRKTTAQLSQHRASAARVRGALRFVLPLSFSLALALTHSAFGAAAPISSDLESSVNPPTGTSALQRLDAAFKLIRDAVSKGEVPGAIALVAHHGRIVRHEAFGFSDPERRVPFRTNTLCWIASVTKPVTAAAAMTLVDEGKLSLDDPVEKHLPEFYEQTDTNGVHYPITVRHLMTHTAGIVNDPPTRPRGVWAIGGALENAWLTETNHEGIVRAIAQSRLLFKPGSQVKYSSAAMFVLGRVMEVVSGKPYAQLVKERILDPLGLKESCFAPPASAAERVSAVFMESQGKREAIFRFNPELKISNAGPDGGLFSYPEELAKFLQLFLDNDGKVLSPSAVRAMLKKQAPGWGLGWALEDGCFHHGGSSGTEVFADPKTGTIGILFLQFSERKGRQVRLAQDFRHAVCAAFEPSGAEAADRQR
ncbi:MAG: beta-lactamase family protein [Verrucomicrobia bacterium]|nr:beta-lactamase family protein [Verrucomicrobiota bacterium]